MKITTSKDFKDVMVHTFTDLTNEKYSKILTKLSNEDIFKSEKNELYTYYNLEENKSVIFIGMGKYKELSAEDYKLSAFKAGKEASKNNIKEVSIKLEYLNTLCYKTITSAFVEGLLHSSYSFDKYLSKKNDFKLNEVSISFLKEKEAKAISALDETVNIMEGVFLARDLVNEPAITLTADLLSQIAVKELEEVGLEVEILSKDDAEKLGMKAFLAVNKGSTNEPKGIIIRHKGGKDTEPIIGLVGKGVTFDTGGYSIKPGPSMMTMYGDMGGAGSVIGAMKAIGKNKLEKNVTAVILATDNMVSGDAYVPGDIIGSMQGKTIEIHSTDAEGRLTLADAVYYAVTKENVSELVDVATLTGACVVALGNFNTGAFTNNDKVLDKVKKASQKAGEPLWQMPLSEEYRKLIKGDRGDLKNSGGRWGGASTAAAFIEEFVEETPWVHLDIAGTSDLDSSNGYLPKGATGVPVKTLYYYIKDTDKNC